MSRRKAADLRKLALKDGTFGSFTPMQGGWDPAWDAPRKIFMLRPYKGHKRERTRAARFNIVVVHFFVLVFILVALLSISYKQSTKD